MDKYEYRLKLEQIKNFIEARDYKAAAKIADGINWKKVKSVATLCMIGELYEKTDQLEESKEVLLMAYDRSPVGRNIIYRLTLVAIKMNNLEEAQEYYEEFLEIAPHDNMKYVLKYEIARFKGASLPELISILEEFKEREYTEEWAFELAYLYHKSGEAEKCVEICDELVLWFGEGRYVEKALELKMIHQPLNKMQEDKYRRIKLKQSGIIEVSPMDELMSGEIIRETVTIPSIQADAGRFNTVNLQEELAKGMQQIMDATEKETVSDTINNIKKMVGEVSYFYDKKPEQAEESPDAETNEQESEEIPEAALNIEFKDILAEEYDGQISMWVPETTRPDLQITGQMSIEDILAEWEKTKEAARIAIEEAEQRRLADMKAKALQEAEDIMERLADVMPLELPEEKPIKETAQTLEEMMAKETGTVQEVAEEEPVLGDLMAREESMLGDLMEEETELKLGDLMAEETEPKQGDQMTEEKESISGDPAAEETEIEPEKNIDMEISEELKPEETASVVEALKAEETAATVGGMKSEETVSQPEMSVEEMAMSAIEKLVETELGETTRAAAGEKKQPSRLSAEQRKIFTYFALISGMEQQICQALEDSWQRRRGRINSVTGNLIIVGGQGSGKTVLAADFTKAYQKLAKRTGSKVGKISASVLNQKDIAKLVEAVKGGCLIIESAGKLSKESVNRLSQLMEQDTQGLMVIMEDNKAGIEKVMSRNPAFSRKFTEQIRIPVFTNDELVAFAKAYAEEQHCEIDNMGVLALYNSISNIQKLEEATTLAEVKEIMDSAISNAKSGGFKKLFGGKRTTQSGYTLIKEKDFEGIRS